MYNESLECYEIKGLINRIFGPNDGYEIISKQPGFLIEPIDRLSSRDNSDIEEQFIQNFYSISFIVGGKCSRANGNEAGQRSCIYLTKPGQLNSISYQPGVTGYLVCFDKDFFVNLDHTKNLFLTFPFLYSLSKTLLNVPDPEKDYFMDLLKRIYREYADFKPISAEFIRLWVIELLFQIKINLKDQTPYNGSDSPMSEQAQKFLEVLEDHFINGLRDKFVPPISVHDIAGQLCVHPGYLSECVKNSLGKTAKSIIMERFLLAAQSSLKSTEMPVSGISYLFGFDNPSYFSRFFKKQVGITPQQYRKQHLSLKNT